MPQDIQRVEIFPPDEDGFGVTIVHNSRGGYARMRYRFKSGDYWLTKGVQEAELLIATNEEVFQK